MHPNDLFPSISLPTLAGDTLDLSQPTAPADWRLLVIYRGRHCPKCTEYLHQLNAQVNRLLAVKIDLVAASADNQEQVAAHQLSVDFPIAYGLTVKQMKSLGLHLSIPRTIGEGIGETDHVFPEPAVFLINDQGRVQVMERSNSPFVRPDIEALVWGCERIRRPGDEYPIRGDYRD